jgi:hypothetical protein
MKESLIVGAVQVYATKYQELYDRTTAAKLAHDNAKTIEEIEKTSEDLLAATNVYSDFPNLAENAAAKKVMDEIEHATVVKQNADQELEN